MAITQRPNTAGMVEATKDKAYRRSPMYATANLASELVQQYGWDKVPDTVAAMASLSRRAEGSKRWQKGKDYLSGRSASGIVQDVKDFATKRRGQEPDFKAYLAKNPRLENNSALRSAQSQYARQKYDQNQHLQVGGQKLTEPGVDYIANQRAQGLRGAPVRHREAQGQKADKGFFHDVKQFAMGEGDQDLGGLFSSALESALPNLLNNASKRYA